MHKSLQILTVLLGLAAGLFTGAVFAQEPQTPAPLTFQQWKDQQVLEAQNQVLRLQARITTLRQTKGASKKEVASIAGGKLKKVSDTVTLDSAEQDLKRAQESLGIANALAFEDYVEVYVPTLADQPEALQKLSDRLSKEELAEVLRTIMKSRNSLDAKRNTALIDGFSHSKTP